jgi:hypothetical protein
MSPPIRAGYSVGRASDATSPVATVIILLPQGPPQEFSVAEYIARHGEGGEVDGIIWPSLSEVLCGYIATQASKHASRRPANARRLTSSLEQKVKGDCAGWLLSVFYEIVHGNKVQIARYGLREWVKAARSDAAVREFSLRDTG